MCSGRGFLASLGDSTTLVLVAAVLSVVSLVCRVVRLCFALVSHIT